MLHLAWLRQSRRVLAEYTINKSEGSLTFAFTNQKGSLHSCKHGVRFLICFLQALTCHDNSVPPCHLAWLRQSRRVLAEYTKNKSEGSLTFAFTNQKRKPLLVQARHMLPYFDSTSAKAAALLFDWSIPC